MKDYKYLHNKLIKIHCNENNSNAIGKITKIDILDKIMYIKILYHDSLKHWADTYNMPIEVLSSHTPHFVVEFIEDDKVVNILYSDL